jgi:hypothetical protein
VSISDDPWDSKAKVFMTCRWYTEELPGAVAARDPPHVTSGEFVKLVEYKLKRGKWRPKLLDYAKAVSAEAAKAATSQALDKAACQGPEKETRLGEAVKTLLKLKVCGLSPNHEGVHPWGCCVC